MLLRVDKPLNKRVQEALLQLIREEQLQPGDQVPTEAELSQRFGVGRSSLREAMGNLVDQGILEKSHGRGTFLRQLPVMLASGLEELTSVTEHIRNVGAVPSTGRMQVSAIEADEALALKLQVALGTACYRIERVRLADSVPAAYCIDIIPQHLLPSALSQASFAESLFDLLSEHHHPVSHTESRITPTVLTRDDLPELESEQAFFLLFEEVNYDVRGVPVCYSNDYYSSQVFEFKIIRKRNLK
jgi:GntR family transcriptional regulator